MLTRCPTCQTTFRVTTEQLKARQGRVRCGQCKAVFNALETLVEATPATAPQASTAPQPPDEPIVIQGFDVSAIGSTPETPSFSDDAAKAVQVPMESATAPPPSAEPEGEEVAETDIEYVEIGDLETGEDTDDMDALVSPDQAFEDEFADTQLNVVENAEPDDDLPSEESSPDDQFTKTVVGFTWYVEPEVDEAPIDAPASDEFTRTVIEPVRRAEPPRTPPPAATPIVDPFAETVVERVRFIEPEETPETAPASLDTQFADTLVEPSITFDAELSPSAIDEPATDAFHGATMEPFGVSAAEAVPAPPKNLETDTFVATVVQSIRIAEPEVAPAPFNEPDTDDFTKTIVDSVRLIDPVAEVAESTLTLAPVGDIHVEPEPEAPSIIDLVPEPPRSFPVLEPLPDLTEQPAHVSANALLQQLAAITKSPSKPAHPIDIEIEVTPEPDIEADAEHAPPTRPGPGATPDDLALDIDTEPTPEAEPVLELQELPAPRRWPWILGGGVAACLLAAQAIVHFRVELSVLMPRSKPALVAMCEVLDCKLPLPSQIDLIGIETSDLSPGPEGAGHLQLAATLRNRAPYGQAWPNLELTLTDAADKALVRRSLAPPEYLPPGSKPEEGFPARSEQSVHLDMKAPGVPAVGYRLYVFYP